MGWNPFKDIKKALKRLEDSVNQDLFDDVLGIEHMSDIGQNMLRGDPTGTTGANKQRIESKTARAEVRAAAQVRKAEEARSLPYILANQALARRRRRMRDQSLMSGAGTGDGMLSNVSATGKNSLGA